MKLLYESADIMKKCIKALSSIVDEGEFVIDNDGLKMRATDPSKIAMVDFIMPKHAFKEFEGEGRAGVNMSDLERVFKKVGAREEVAFLVENNRFVVEIEGRAKRRFLLPLVDLGGSDLPAPKIDFTAEVKVVADVISSALNDAEYFSTHVTFEAGEDVFRIFTSGSRGEYSLELKKGQHDALLGMDLSESARASFPLDYLQDMLSQASRSAAVSLSLKTDAPLKLTYGIGDADVVFYLAPRIETG